MRIQLCVLGLALLVGGCGDDSGTGGTGGTGGSGGADAAVDAAADAPSGIDAPAGGCGMADGGQPSGAHIVYLVFDGVALTSGTTCDDSRTNCTSLATADTTVPAFAMTMANRQQFLNSIVTAMQQQLAPYDIEVVTTRPASGDYVMIVFAQCVSSLSCQTGLAALAPNDCMSTNADDIALVYETSGIPANGYAGLAIFDLGITIGVGTTQVQGDCMNDNGSSVPCIFGTDVPVHQSGCVPAGTHQNEDRAFENAFGCR